MIGAIAFKAFGFVEPQLHTYTALEKIKRPLQNYQFFWFLARLFEEQSYSDTPA